MSIRPALFAVLAIAFLQSQPAAADEAASMEAVRTAVTDLDQAYTDQDAATIGRMVTAGHISIASRYGGAASAAEQIATFADLERTFAIVTPIDVILLADDIALATYEKTYTGSFKGVPLPDRVAASSIWIRQDGAWRQRFYQETAIGRP